MAIAFPKVVDMGCSGYSLGELYGHQSCRLRREDRPKLSKTPAFAISVFGHGAAYAAFK
jgi:hypothetical protein